MLLFSLLLMWQTWDPEWVRTDSGSHSNSGADLRSEPRGLGPLRPGYFLRKWQSRVHGSETPLTADFQGRASQGKIDLTSLASDPPQNQQACIQVTLPLPTHPSWAMLLHKA